MMLMQIKNLSVTVNAKAGGKKILDDVSLQISQRSIFALVGGSGSGKSTTGLSILRLLDPGLTISSGEVLFSGRDILKLPPEQLRQVRGKDIAMVFQEPLYAFNPVLPIGRQIEEVFKSYGFFSTEKNR